MANIDRGKLMKQTDEAVKLCQVAAQKSSPFKTKYIAEAMIAISRLPRVNAKEFAALLDVSETEFKAYLTAARRSREYFSSMRKMSRVQPETEEVTDLIQFLVCSKNEVDDVSPIRIL